MKVITVPEDVGGELRLLPEGVARATLEKVIFGKSGQNQPKLTARYVITDEMEGVGKDDPSTVGENVLETFSLQPQALFSLNATYKAVTGEKLPQGDYSPEEFTGMMADELEGTEWDLFLEQLVPSNIDIEGMSEAEVEANKRTTIVKKELVR